MKMNMDYIDLARRLISCKGFYWMPGMRASWIGMDTGWRILSHSDSWYEGEGIRDSLPGGPTKLPDLTDPATLGCLLTLVRRAWRDQRLVAIYCEAANPNQSEGWAVQSADNRLPIAGEDYMSEAEALVVAMESAP